MSSFGVTDGPVVYWQPFAGTRHAVERVPRPREGEVRDTLCGVPAEIARPGEVDWLAPTRAECWTRALALRDSR